MATIVTRSGKGSPLTHAEVDANFTNLNTDKLELSGGTMTGDLTFGDSNKAIFGAGSDLQIYHDGTNSFITDVGTGALVIRGANELYLQSTASNNYFVGQSGGAATIYHNNVAKLATTSTGINVTGSGSFSTSIAVGQTSFSGGSVVADFHTSGSGVGTQLAFANDHNTDKFFVGLEGNTTGNAFLYQQKDADINFYTNNTLRATLDNSGNLGIGTSSPSSYYSTDLVIAAPDEGGVTLVSDTTHTAYLMFADGTSGADRYRGQLSYDHNVNEMAFATNGSERMRIDSSGNVGIGISSGFGGKLDISIGTNARGYFSDNIGEVGSGNFALQVVNSAGSALKPLGFRAEDIRFATGSAERMRIDSNSLHVGRTTADSSVAGFTAQSSGVMYNAFAGRPYYVNRLSSDGDIIELAKDGTTVGSIGVTGGDILYIANPDGSDVGFNFDGDNPKINPCNGTGSGTDGVADLGWSGGRYKDLYLSGGVYLGGTGAANKLEDYEEGTFTPTGNGVTFTASDGRYTKIGNIVRVGIYVVFPSTSDSGDARISGLPFTCSNLQSVRAGLSVAWHNKSSSNGLAILTTNNDTFALFYLGSTFQTNANMSGVTAYIGGTYQTDS